MQISDEHGIMDFPVILILCILLASFAIGLGLRGLEEFGRLRKRRNSIRKFDRLIETATEVAYGDIGGNQKINLELNGEKITIDGRLVQLRKDKEVLKSELLPLPFRREEKDNFTICGGKFSIGLRTSDSYFDKNENSLFLKLSEQYS